jgi:hypothetical protein
MNILKLSIAMLTLTMILSCKDDLTSHNNTNPYFLPRGEYYSIACLGDRIFVGGECNGIRGEKMQNIAMWDGTKWSAMENGLSGSVKAIAVMEMARTGT